MLNVFNSALVSITLLASIQPAMAQEQIDCENPVSTREINHCGMVSYEAADKELNRVYKQIMAKLNEEATSPKLQVRQDAKESKLRLIEAQRAWIDFRIANSVMHGVEMLDGSGEGIVRISVDTDMTKERTEELAKLFLRNEVKQYGIVDLQSSAERLGNVEHRVTSALMNDVLSDDEYTRHYGQESLSRLKVSQDAWEKFRDANATMHGIAMLNSSGEARIRVGTKHDMTLARAKELSKLFLQK